MRKSILLRCAAVLALLCLAAALPLTVLAHPVDADLSVTVNGSPVAAGATLNMQVGDSVSGSGTATNLETGPGIYYNILFGVLSAPAGNTLGTRLNASDVLTDNTDANWTLNARTATIDVAGTYTLRFAVTDGVSTTYASLSFTIEATAPPPPEPPAAQPGTGDTAAPAETGDDAFWMPAQSRIVLGDAATLRTDAPAARTYIPHYILQALNDTGRTLVVSRGGTTFTFSGGTLAQKLDVNRNHTFEELLALGFAAAGALQTGDTANLPLWAGLSTLALTGLAGLVVYAKRRHRQGQR